MSDKESNKPVVWIGSSLVDIGYALYFAQDGIKHSSAKPLKGFKGAGVLEIVENYDGDTYRAVYTVRMAGVVYVLHTFQKKFKQGITTPRQDIALIAARLKLAEAHHLENYDQST
jgi:phage-related protein